MTTEEMAAATAFTPRRDPTPSTTLPSAPAQLSVDQHSPSAPHSFTNSIPLKRSLENAHSPTIPCPSKPEGKTTPAKTVQLPAPNDDKDTSNAIMVREKRAKKESLKKRESKVVQGGDRAGGGGRDSLRATPEPRQKRDLLPAEMAPIRYRLTWPKATDFEAARGPVLTNHHKVQDAEGRAIEFFETSEHVYNKKNFQYTRCIADPAFPSMFYYRHTETEPYGAHISFEDAASHMFLDRTGCHISTNKGFRMARTNVAVREGRWYWECRITQGMLKKSGPDDPDAHGHVRVGFARREASLDAPVGFDAYSYGIRDVAGQKVHMSRPKDFFPPGEDLEEGDVVGLEIQLPPEHLHRKVVQGSYNPAVDLLDEADDVDAEAPNIVRDRIPIRFKAHIYFERFDYHTCKDLEDLANPSPMSSAGAAASVEPPNPNHPLPSLRTLPNSHIRVYKNGKLMGTAWDTLLAFLPPASKPLAQPGAREGLDDGMVGYYPTVSVFRGGAVEANFGPDFWYPPPGYDAPSRRTTHSGEDAEIRDATDGAPAAAANDTSATTGGGGVGGDKNLKIRACCERYDEQIAEDIVYDIIDDVDFWVQDGCRVLDRFELGGFKAGDPQAAGVGGDGKGEEIKELVQDD